MNKTNKTLKSLLSLILCTVLIAALALCTVGCNDSGEKESPETSADTTATAAGTSDTAGEAGTEASDVTVKGEGATVFYFNVVDAAGETARFEIHTDKTIVGEALQELGLVEGEEGAYGLFVKKVNGITADYDVDGSWWAFYIGDDMAPTGVDVTKIQAGATYAFKVSK